MDKSLDIAEGKTMVMDLSADEIRMVEESRRVAARDASRQAYWLKVLEVAYRYELWLQDNRAGSTYSTFCNDFAGYDGPNRSLLFKQVEEMRASARDFAKFAVG